MRCWMMAAAVVLVAQAAQAAGYDDYMRANELRRTGQYEAALTAFTAALADGDLSPNYLPDAHLGRADMLMRKGRCAEAIADLDAALTARPNLVEALTMRAHANSCTGKLESALADFNSAIAIMPNTGLYMVRGNFLWFHGDFAAAAADYQSAAKAQPKHAYDPRAGLYSLLWYAVSAARAKIFDAVYFKQSLHDLGDDDWPGPLLDFFAGTATLDEVHKEAARSAANSEPRQSCDADFFVGEWQIAAGNADGKHLLENAMTACSGKYDVGAAARRDLKRLP